MAFTKVLGPGIHTQANIHSHNINSSGIITATKFVGPITGGGGDFNAGIVTCTTLDVNGNGDISGNLVLGGNLTVNGTTTTLDTNLIGVDRVEVTTAGTNVAVAVTHNGTGDLVRLYDGTSQKVTVDDEGKVGINTTVPAEKLSVSVTGNQRENFAKFEHIGQQNFFIQGQWGDKDIGGANGTLLYGSGTVALRAATSGNAHLVNLANGNIGIGTVTPGKNLDIWNTSAAADLRLKTTANSFNSLILDSARAKDTQFAIIDGRWNGNDVARIQFVTGSDDTNYDDGYMAFHTRKSGETLSERLRITSDGELQAQREYAAVGINTFARFARKGNGGPHLEIGYNAVTTDYGYFGTGTAHDLGLRTNDVTRLRITTAGKIGIGTNDPTRGPLHIHENSNSDVQIHLTNQETGVTSSDGFTIFAGGDAGPACGFVNRETGGTIEFYTHNGTSVGERLRIDSSGNLLPAAAGTQDLGSTSKEFRHLYLGDTGKAFFGLDQDFSIWHNNSHGLIKNTTGRLYLLSDDLWVKNEADNKTSARFMDGGEVFLYNNDTLRLTTTSTGITVGGEVAASQDYPNYRPTLDFNFAQVKKLDSRFTYTRIGPASYVDEFKHVVSVADNTPRFDHDFITGESKGLLIEESRTNYIKNSHGNGFKSQGAMGDYTEGWVQQSTTNSTITQFAAEGPDGTTSALKYTLNATSARRLDYEGLSTTNGTVYCFSWWMKRLHSGSVWSYQQVGGSGVTSGQILIDGVDASGQTSTYTPADDNWHRVTWKFTKTNTETMTLGGYDSSGNTGDRWLLWGAQFEAGAFPTSYMPTNGSTATRGVDIVKIDGTEFTDFYNQSEGTLLSEFTINDPANANSLTSGAIANINALSSDSYADSIMFMEIGNANGYFGRVYKSSNGTQLMNGSSVIADLMGGAGPDRVSFAWSDTVVDEGLASYWNGSVVNTSATETNTPTNMTELRIGRGWGSQYINAHIKRLSYYPKRLPNSQLATLTS